MSIPAKAPAPAGDIMEQVLLKGDIAKLTPNERVQYYASVCQSMGLNPLTKPFEFITLNGKLQLYALRSCTDQLRKINNVSLEIVSKDVADGILTVHVRASMPDGRKDEDLGSVSFPETLKGDARANAELKAVTKAKRRATLSICGLGWLDETEVADIPASAKRPVAAPNVLGKPVAVTKIELHDPSTGEIVVEPETGADLSSAAPAPRGASSPVLPAADPSPPEPRVPPSAGARVGEEQFEAIDRYLAAEASKGSAALQTAWKNLTPGQQRLCKRALDARHKPAAEAADKASEEAM